MAPLWSTNTRPGAADPLASASCSSAARLGSRRLRSRLHRGPPLSLRVEHACVECGDGAASTQSTATAVQLGLDSVLFFRRIAALMNVIFDRPSRVIDRGRTSTGGWGRRCRPHTVATPSVDAMSSVHLDGSTGTAVTCAMLAPMIGVAFFMHEVHSATNDHVGTGSGSTARQASSSRSDPRSFTKSEACCV